MTKFKRKHSATLQLRGGNTVNVYAPAERKRKRVMKGADGNAKSSSAAGKYEQCDRWTARRPCVPDGVIMCKNTDSKHKMGAGRSAPRNLSMGCANVI